MRENWRAVGEALLVGRRLFPGDRKFGQWCVTQGFDMDRRRRADAMWLAENFSTVRGTDTEAVTPTEIRRLYNEAQAEAALENTEADSIVPTKTIELDTRSAEKVVKLVRRSEAGDEGSAMAKRHVEALAKKHDVTTEQLTKAAARKAPGPP